MYVGQYRFLEYFVRQQETHDVYSIYVVIRCFFFSRAKSVFLLEVYAKIGVCHLNKFFFAHNKTLRPPFYRNINNGKMSSSTGFASLLAGNVTSLLEDCAKEYKNIQKFTFCKSMSENKK